MAQGKRQLAPDGYTFLVGRAHIFSFGTFALIVAAGCSNKEEPKAMPGWSLTSASGITIQFPSELKVSDLSSGDVDEIRMRTKDQFSKSPEMQKLIEGLVANGSMKLVGMMPNSASQPMPNSFNLVVQPAASSVTAVQLIEPNRAKMKAAAIPGTLTVELRDYKAGQCAYFEFDTASGLAAHSQISYMFVKGGSQYVFTFSCPVSEKPKWSSVAETAIKTMQFGS